ncbi:nSTAND1 domain-containing NTPase [Streptomyces orinoci]|uniref:Novel STAND NTPase 1 domain-containing protein n=1 Tax=Streptomyces orinoci TaxID=67339 RepID=A0ABV3K3F9_STRON|nr:hypothetical protein [Streptomyces orinoci]
MPRRERPLDEGDAPLLRFAADLRLLRQRAGSPTYRQLALRAHSSAASLSVAAGGRKLPTLAVTSAYVRACGGDVKEWEARWHTVAASLTGPGGSHHPPYPGAAPYQVTDSGRYFGRERLVEEVCGRLRAERVAVVTGPSGCGKTSLLNAGPLARLRAADPAPAVLSCTPGPQPGRTLTRCLAHLARERPPGGPRPLLVVDQLEQLRTHCPHPAEARRFLDALWQAARPGTAPCRLLLAVRSDALPYFTGHPLLAQPLTMAPMTPEELHRAIVEPAARADCTVEDRLLAVLIAGAAGQPGALPLLSRALLATWRARTGTLLTLARFRETGGIERTLAEAAESAFTALPGAGRERARQVLLRLVDPGGPGGVPRPVPRGTLDDDPGTAAVLEHLAAARVLTLDGDRVALAHGAAQHAWPRLARWTAEDPEGLRRRQALTEAAAAWRAAGRDPALLYRGRRLAEARRPGPPDDRLTAAERDFLAAGARAQSARRRREADRRARLRGQRRLIALLATLVTTLALVVAATAPLAVR